MIFKSPFDFKHHFPAILQLAVVKQNKDVQLAHLTYDKKGLLTAYRVNTHSNEQLHGPGLNLAPLIFNFSFSLPIPSYNNAGTPVCPS